MRNQNKIPIDIDRIKRAAKKAVGGQISEPFPARLGHPDPTSVTDPIIVSRTEAGAPGYIWVHGVDNIDADDASADYGGATMVLNAGAFKLRREEMVYGAFILIRRRPRSRGGYVIAGDDPDQNPEYMDGANIRPQTSINLSQFDNGLLQPTNPAGMQVIVSGAVYHYGGTAYNVPSLTSKDFTADIPGTPGQAVAILVSVLPGVPRLIYKKGVTFATTLSHTEAFTAYYPQPTAGGMAAGWVRLENGMSAIQLEDNVLPAHEVLNSDSAARSYVSLYGDMFIGSDGTPVVRGK